MENQTGNGCTHPINIRLLLRKAEVGHALVLDFPQQIVLEKRLDSRVLERLALRVFLPQPLHILLVQQAGRKVLNAEFCSGRLGVSGGK